jgi:aryl carrier-like protein
MSMASDLLITLSSAGLVAVGYLLAHLCPIGQLRAWLRSGANVDIVESLRHALGAPPAARFLDLLDTVFTLAAEARQRHSVRRDLVDLGLDLVPGRLAALQTEWREFRTQLAAALAPVPPDGQDGAIPQ